MNTADQPLTVGELLRRARAELTDPHEAVLLVGHALGLPDVTLYAHPEREVPADELARASRLVERRAAGEPVAYLLGAREFYGLPLRVTPDVLIPRPETELLVDLALERLDPDAPARVLDLGTGSGAIAVAIAQARPAARVFAVDRSEAALAVARGNAQCHDLSNLAFLQGEWFEPVAGQHFDLIVSNPPYVAAADPHLQRGDVRHEPVSALAAGPEGLDDLRRIIATAPEHLDAGGWLLLEHGADQQTAVLELLAARGFAGCLGHRDLAGLPRAVSARRQ
jgi:release factor glutamine methyltransferase